jgi:hypothetical protein
VRKAVLIGAILAVAEERSCREQATSLAQRAERIYAHGCITLPSEREGLGAWGRGRRLRLRRGEASPARSLRTTDARGKKASENVPA